MIRAIIISEAPSVLVFFRALALLERLPKLAATGPIAVLGITCEQRGVLVAGTPNRPGCSWFSAEWNYVPLGETYECRYDGCQSYTPWLT